MDPLTLGLELAQFVPQLTKWITGSDKAADVAQKAITIAQTVTGQPTGDAALKALQAAPALVLQYREAILNQEVEFNKLAVANAADVNASIQAETKADHWPTYSWRPFIGFQFGLYLMAQWLLPLFSIGAPLVDPTLITATGAILGIASWFRGKAQAAPDVVTDNRG